MCRRLPRAWGAEDEGCWRPRTVGMLRMERLLLAPEKWKISRAQTPQGALCQRPAPGASRNWGVLVPSGYGGSEVCWSWEGLSRRSGGSHLLPWPPGGQAHVGKAHVDPLRLGLEGTLSTWAPSQPPSSGHLLSRSPILERELLLVLGSVLGNWWLDGRTSFDVVESDRWMYLDACGHRHQ